MRSDDDEIPPSVYEAFDNATPNRKYRVATAAVGVSVSAISGGLAIAGLTGQYDNPDVLLFGNAFVTLAADIIVGGTSAWALQQEERTKRENVDRIWQEVKRRRTGGAASGSNRSQRRAKKVEVAGGAMPGAGGFGAASPPRPAPRPPPAPRAPPPNPPAATKEDVSADDGGLFAGVNAFMDEGNELGKAGAINLNAQLEDAGVLPPVVPSGAAEAAASPGVDGNAAEGAASPPPAPESAATPETAARSAAGGGGSRKGGKKKKKKRK